ELYQALEAASWRTSVVLFVLTFMTSDKVPVSTDWPHKLVLVVFDHACDLDNVSHPFGDLSQGASVDWALIYNPLIECRE
ncbi:hypothetical protein BKA56DRAFT_602905, partial [Ilyonectria sp. MPI-CAGE-AT-0026]